VVDLLRSAEMGCDVSAVTITGGERERLIGRGSGPNWSVPKRNLMADVQVLLERRDLKIARALPHARSPVRELMDVRVAAGGPVKTGADGCGERRRCQSRFVILIELPNAQKWRPAAPAQGARSPMMRIRSDLSGA